MSAFAVGREHIRYIVDAVTRLQPADHGDFRYYHDGKCRRVLWPGCDGVGEGDVTPEALGQMLWNENIASVLHRYPHDTRETMPGPVGESFEYGTHRRCQRVTPEQTIQAIGCLEDQSCEHPGWEASEAHTFCRALHDLAVSRILGRHDLAWEIRDADNVVGREAAAALARA